MHNSIIKQVAHCDRNDGSWQNGIVAHSHRTDGSFGCRLFNYIDNDGTYNHDVPTLDHIPGSDDKYYRKEIKFLDGRTVKLKAGFYAVTKSYTDNGGYQISYYCDKYRDWDKHKTCELVLGL